jgi:hypothetical protein
MVLAEIGYIPLDVAKRAKMLRRKEFMRSNDNSVTGWRHLRPCGGEGTGSVMFLITSVRQVIEACIEV